MRYDQKTKRLIFGIDEVLFINTERKTLPFRLAPKAKNRDVTSWQQFEAIMAAGCGLTKIDDPDKAAYYEPVKLVAVDSFTRLSYLLSEFLKSKQIKGFDFWRDYGDIIEKLLITWQSNGRFIVFTALDEVIQDADNIDRIVVRVEGRKMRGAVESFFSIVLHTHFNRTKPLPECYQFCTNSDGRNTAKSPDGMFKDKYIQNDLSAVLGAVYDYYGMDKNPDFQPSPIIITGKSGSGKSSSFKYLFEEE